VDQNVFSWNNDQMVFHKHVFLNQLSCGILYFSRHLALESAVPNGKFKINLGNANFQRSFGKKQNHILKKITRKLGGIALFWLRFTSFYPPIQKIKWVFGL